MMGTQGRTKPCLHSAAILLPVLFLWAFCLNAATGEMFCPPAQENAAYNITAERYNLDNVSDIEIKATWLTAFAVCSLSTQHCSNESKFVEDANFYEIRKIGDKGIQALLGVDRFVPLLERTFTIKWEIGENVYYDSCSVTIGNPINECYPLSPCVNAALCTDLPVGYKCDCSAGFSGINCNAADHQLHCERSEYQMLFIQGGGNCKTFNNSCSVAGLDYSTELDLGFNLTSDLSQFDVQASILDNNFSFTVCTLNSTQNGQDKITYQLHSKHSKTSYQVQVVVEVFINNTAPVFNSPFNGDPYVFNVPRSIMTDKARIVTVAKAMSRSRSCDYNSCIEVIDPDTSSGFGISSLVLEVTLDNTWDQLEEGSGSLKTVRLSPMDESSGNLSYVQSVNYQSVPILYQEEDTRDAFGYFYFLGDLRLATKITYSLKVTDGEEVSASAKVLFNITDVNGPLSCDTTPMIITIYLRTHPDSHIGNVSCSDTDVDPIFQKIGYTITGDHSDYFRVTEDGHLVLSRAVGDLDPRVLKLTLTATGYSAEQDNNYVFHIPVIVNVKADRCAPETADYLYFEETPVGSEITISCPGMYTGHITRSCFLNQTWGPLNYNCNNEELRKINTAVTDGDEASASAKVLFNITDVNGPLSCDTTPMIITIYLRTHPDSHIGNVSCSDTDVDPIFQKIDYTITGDHSDYFRVTEDGHLVLSRAVQDLDPGVLNLTLTATGYSAEQDNNYVFHIPVIVNVIADRCAPETADYLYFEETPVGSEVTISCPGMYTGHITRSCFLNQTWGPLNYNCNNEELRKINTVVTDGDEASASAKVLFNITDVNGPLSCDTTPMIITIYLRTHPDSHIGNVSCSDTDVDPIFQKIDYTITGDHSDYFRVTEDGHLVLSRAVQDLDPGVLNLTLTATGYSAEQDNNYVFHIPVIVNVIADRCEPETADYLYFEETPVGSEVTISCPGMYTGHITRSCFLNQTWGPLNYNCSNEELGNINTAVTDGGEAPASAKVLFNITDVNGPLSCDTTPMIITIYLRTHPDSHIGNVSCSDTDVDPIFQKIDYTITGDHSDYFRVTEDGHLVLSRDVGDLDPGILNLTLTTTRYNAEQDKNYVSYIPVTVNVIADRCAPETSYHFHFEETPVDSEVSISCPFMYTGQVTRRCFLNQTWGRVNYSNCSNDELRKINIQMANFIARRSELSPTEIKEKMRAVAVNLTIAINEYSLVPPTDIIQTVEILTKVKDLITFKDAGLDRDTVKKFVSTANVIFDTDDETWKEANEDFEGGAKMMHALDSIVTAGLRDDRPVDADPFVTKHLELTTSVSRDDIVYTSNRRTEDNSSDMTIQLVTSAFLSKKAFINLRDAVKYSVVLYKNLTDKLQINPKLQSGKLRGKVINSDVLAFVVNVTLTTLLSPLQLNFSVLQANYTQPSCGFLDTSARVAGVWSTEGCTTIDLGDTVQCSCDHLTNFAVLMNPYGNDMSSYHKEALSIISAVGCGISMFCLVITIIVYLCLWKYVKGDRSVLHINLSACLVAAYIVFLVGVDRTGDQVGCKVVAALLHYLFLAVFFIMLSEGIEIFKSVSFVFSSGSILCKLIPLSYGVPLIIVAVSLGVTKTEGYGSDTSCWLSTKGGLIWAFVGPVLLVILINFFILIQVLRIMQRTKLMIDKPAQEKAKSVVRTIFILSPLLGVTWVFGVLSVNKDAIVFQYLFAILNSLQGLFIFICYCLLTPQVRDGFREVRRKHRARSFDSGQKMVSSSSAGKFIIPPGKSFKKASEKSNSFNNVETPTQDSSFSETRDMDS